MTTFEALFVAADDPAEAAGFLSTVLGTTALSGSDGQRIVSGLGAFVVVEPSGEGLPAGTVTTWLRAEDATARFKELVEAGCEPIEEPKVAGDETVAVVRTPHGMRIGLISG